MEVASAAATWAGIDVQKNLTFRVVQTCHLQTTSPWLSFLCGPNSQHPFHPLPTQPLSQKSPSHDEQSFTGPHLLTYLASQQLSLKMLKHSLLARWRSVVPPPRHTGRASAISSTASAGAKTRLNDIFVPNGRSLGGLTALLAGPCSTSSPSALNVSYSDDRPQRGKPYIRDTDTKGSWFLASTAACWAAFNTVCSGLLQTGVIYVGTVLPLSPVHNGSSQWQVLFPSSEMWSIVQGSPW